MRRSIGIALVIALLAAACGGGGGSGGPGDGGSNLVNDSNGEEGQEGYVGHGGATVSLDSNTSSVGSASVKVEIPDAAGAGVQVWQPDGLTQTPVTAGGEYQFSADVKGDAGKSVRMEILWHRADGTFLVTTLGEIFSLPTDDFKGFTLAAEAPDEAAQAVPQIVTDAAPGASFTLWIDNVSFRETSAAPGSSVTPPATP